VTSNAHAPAQHAPTVTSHWWWRPGWGPGRRGYAWHINVGLEPLHDHATAYQRAISHLPQLDLIPLEWLHLTVQGVGFVDETSDEDVAAIVEATRRRLADVTPIRLTFDRPIQRPEALAIHPTPAEPLVEVRTMLRDAIAEVWGPDKVEGSADGFQPHVSLAYVNAPGPSDEIVASIDQVTAEPVELVVDTVSLIELFRDGHLYRWDTVHKVTLGAT
jgi:2'-5' RNA ligase